jgi:hypothetical protein
VIVAPATRNQPEPGGDLTAEQRERVGHAVEQARSTGDDEGL